MNNYDWFRMDLEELTKDTQEGEDAIENFVDALPHGSGIDCDWHGSIKGNFVIFSNSYHCMNDHGYYVGYQDFSVKFDKKDFTRMVEAYKSYHRHRVQSDVNKFDVCQAYMRHDFKLVFNGNQYLAGKYQLREYLEDTIYYSIFQCDIY